MAVTTFFENRTTDGISTVVVENNEGGTRAVKVTGVMDGARAYVLMDFTDGDFARLNDGVFREVNVKNVLLPPGCTIKMEVENAGALTDITAKIL